jgi:hypothetical protein
MTLSQRKTQGNFINGDSVQYPQHVLSIKRKLQSINVFIVLHICVNLSLVFKALVS